MIKRLLNSKPIGRRRYSSSIRRFCLGLHYHSPRAYEYVRKAFNKSLPHVGTLRLWYSNSKIIDEPGINEAVVIKLKELVAEKAAKGENLIVCLSSDEMNIRKHIQWYNQSKQPLCNH